MLLVSFRKCGCGNLYAVLPEIPFEATDGLYTAIQEGTNKRVGVEYGPFAKVTFRALDEEVVEFSKEIETKWNCKIIPIHMRSSRTRATYKRNLERLKEMAKEKEKDGKGDG